MNDSYIKKLQFELQTMEMLNSETKQKHNQYMREYMIQMTQGNPIRCCEILEYLDKNTQQHERFEDRINQLKREIRKNLLHQFINDIPSD